MVGDTNHDGDPALHFQPNVGLLTEKG